MEEGGEKGIERGEIQRERERERRAGGRGRDGESVRGERDDGEIKGWKERVRERGRLVEGVETERKKGEKDRCQ